MTCEAHGMGPRQIGQRTTVERDRKMTGAGREDTESKNI